MGASFREWLFGCEHSICELWVFVLRVEHSFLWLWVFVLRVEHSFLWL